MCVCSSGDRNFKRLRSDFSNRQSHITSSTWTPLALPLPARPPALQRRLDSDQGAAAAAPTPPVVDPVASLAWALLTGASPGASEKRRRRERQRSIHHRCAHRSPTPHDPKWVEPALAGFRFEHVQPRRLHHRPDFGLWSLPPTLQHARCNVLLATEQTEMSSERLCSKKNIISPPPPPHGCREVKGDRVALDGA